MAGYTSMQDLRFKGKKIKIKCSTSLKRTFHVDSKILNLEGILLGYTFMQNLWLTVKNTLKSSFIYH